MHYSVISIEEGKIVLEGDNLSMQIVSQKQFCIPVKEGDVLTFTNGAFLLDEKETLMRKEKVKQLLDNILGQCERKAK